jgi:hypothetical protein
VEPRPKNDDEEEEDMTILIRIGHECIWRTVWESHQEAGRRKGKHIYIQR